MPIEFFDSLGDCDSVEDVLGTVLSSCIERFLDEMVIDLIGEALRNVSILTGTKFQEVFLVLDRDVCLQISQRPGFS